MSDQFIPLLDEQQIFTFLESRFGKLNGICITGGEPLLQKDISQFITHMKALGFDVKLDTNGSFPDKLEEIIKEGEVGYIAMDIKGTLEKYPLISNFQSFDNLRTGFPISNELSNSKSPNEHLKNERLNENWQMKNEKLIKNIQKSIKLIMNSGIPYEFRTTVAHPLHEVKDFEGIGEMIRGADKYFIQNFVHSKHINSAIDYQPFTDKELKDAKKIMKKYVKEVEVR